MRGRNICLKERPTLSRNISKPIISLIEIAQQRPIWIEWWIRPQYSHLKRPLRVAQTAISLKVAILMPHNSSSLLELKDSHWANKKADLMRYLSFTLDSIYQRHRSNHRHSKYQETWDSRKAVQALELTHAMLSPRTARPTWARELRKDDPRPFTHSSTLIDW